MAEEPVINNAVQNEDDEDEFERLRRKSALTSNVYDEMEDGESSTNPLSRLTPVQIGILGALAVVDTIAVVVVLLMILQVI